MGQARSVPPHFVLACPRNQTLRIMKLAPRCLLGVLLTIHFHLTAAADDKPAKPAPQTYLTIETASPDYADQGEYSNDWGGAQVIALGNDRFRLVIYQGGLPGAGWDPSAATK